MAEPLELLMGAGWPGPPLPVLRVTFEQAPSPSHTHWFWKDGEHSHCWPLGAEGRAVGKAESLSREGAWPPEYGCAAAAPGVSAS